MSPDAFRDQTGVLVEFARVHGRVVLDDACVDGGLRVIVVVETRGSVRTVRDECVSRLADDSRSDDLAWTADQYTQETIGTDMAKEGWEAISISEGGSDRGGIDRATVTYVIRRV